MITYPAKLSLHALNLMAHLGYGEEERKIAQPIILDIDFYFGALPLAASQDGKGFLCYDGLTQHLKTFLKGKQFALIEYLTPALGDAIASWLKEHQANTAVDDIRFTLSLLKSEAPVDELYGGASFTYTTLPEGLTGA